jgi:hypothetical protein
VSPGARAALRVSPAQQLRQVRVCRGELNEQPEELRQGRAEAAVRGRDADLAEPGLAQPADLAVWQPAAGLAAGRLLRDLGEYRAELLLQFRRLRGLAHA